MPTSYSSIISPSRKDPNKKLGTATADYDIQAITMATNNTEKYKSELAYSNYELSRTLQNYFAEYYQNYMKNPSQSWNQANMKYLVEFLQKSIANVYVIKNSIQKSIDDLNNMVEYMEDDMNQVKSVNSNLKTKLTTYKNENASSDQMVSDNILNNKTEKYKLFFYIVGVCFLLYFFLHKILKLSFNDTASIATAANVAIQQVAQKVNEKTDKVAEKVNETVGEIKAANLVAKKKDAIEKTETTTEKEKEKEE